MTAAAARKPAAGGSAPSALGHAVDLVLPFGELIYDDERVYCHLCGKGYKQLAFHLRAHHISPASYRELCGLKRMQPLCSPSESERLRKQDALRPYYTDPEFLAQSGARLSAIPAPRGQWRAQTRATQMPSRHAWAATRRGVPLSQETKRKIGEANGGKTRAKHGSLSRYGWGCRCSECREAATAWRRTWGGYKSKQEHLAMLAAQAAPHGSAKRYWCGCRCPECQDAGRRYRRELRDKRKGAPSSNVVPRGSR